MSIKKLVIDSSVIVKWLSSDKEANLEQADVLLQDVQDGKAELYSTELAKYEIGNALLKGKGLHFSDAKISLATLYALPIQFIPESKELAEDTYQLGEKSNMTYYDASFLSLAQMLNGILVTDNIKHQGKAKSIKVMPLSEYK